VAAGIEPWRDTSNIYIKPSYASALYEVSQQFHLSGVASSPGAVLKADFAQKIIQLFGHATHDDAEYVANSGLHGVATALFVEDQPNVEGAAGYTPRFEWFTKLLDGDFGNTHSLTLVVDSLALMDVLSRASPDLTLNQLNSIFAAASNQRATMQANNGNPKAAEGDSLEKVLDSLRKIFTRQAYATDPVTGSFRENGGFANRANRDKFYERLGEVSNAVKAQTDAGRTLKIVPLIGTTYGNDASGRMNTFVPRDLVDVLAGAKLTGADGLAYRYALKEKMPYDVDKDFAPVTLIATSPWVVVTSRNAPVNNVKELVDLAKAQPGKLSFGSSEPSSRLTGEQFKMQSKVSLTNIPYKGGAQIMTDVAGGHLEVGFTSVLTALQYYKSDRLRVLAVAGKRRSPSMPDIPTVTESGLPGYETFAWSGMYAPAGTPKERNKLQQEIARISNLPDVKARLLQLGAESAATTPDEFAAFTKNELVKYADLIKNAGIQRGD
jgi:tripartite-type tricarboxylate transporter receptor subunit TctC